jgi:hypothetical protein
MESAPQHLHGRERERMDDCDRRPSTRVRARHARECMHKLDRSTALRCGPASLWPLLRRLRILCGASAPAHCSPGAADRARGEQCTTIFRTIQLALAATLDPGLATLGLLSVSFTCLISIVFNQRAFARQYRRVTAVDEQAVPRGSTPLPVSFNRLVTRRPDTPDKPQWSPGASVELGQVHVETRQD